MAINLGRPARVIATSDAGRPSSAVGSLVLINVLDQRVYAVLQEHDDLYDPVR